MEKNIPILNKRIFWDTDFSKLDYKSHAASIIERVFERGDVEDIRQVRRFYGDEKVKEVLLNAKWLRYDIFLFVKNLFDLKSETFRCYTMRQSKEIPWLY
ncbi:hypothetical protein A8C56_15310 [Niabella ginsenosidivorans]|uniref:DUF6922 domain-containing protein n=1 Tax=Niabella ginsenosidivorans TaxID=1176587 RepID=A0A1A9I3F7_9BACT|nr:hypothetical protein [Niabella ginsenosidivorans]ANH82156.1 hypothetical protein A8C56_15310 [Niabella ginsenosidivorans]